MYISSAVRSFVLAMIFSSLGIAVESPLGLPTATGDAVSISLACDWLDDDPAFESCAARSLYKPFGDLIARASFKELAELYFLPNQPFSQSVLRVAVVQKFVQAKLTKDDIAFVSSNYNAMRTMFMAHLESSILRRVKAQHQKDDAKELYALFLAFFTAQGVVFEKFFHEVQFSPELISFQQAGRDAIDALMSSPKPQSWLSAWGIAFMSVQDFRNETNQFLARGKGQWFSKGATINHDAFLKKWLNPIVKSSFPELTALAMSAHAEFQDTFFRAAYKSTEAFLKAQDDFQLSPTDVMEALSRELWARIDLPFLRRPITRDRREWETVTRHCKSSHEDLAQNPYVISLRRILEAKQE